MCKVKFIWVRFLLLFATVLVALILPRIRVRGANATPLARKTVVVELFTSEGCSSCPPADELLGRLRQENFVDGLEVIPLGLHVDYWNSLGWTDRFSSADYSRRQEQYAERFGIEGPYTPQMVVDGDQQFVGNDRSRAREAIVKEATRAQAAAIEISMVTPEQINIRIQAPEATAGEVFLAITEDNLSTKVRAGENTGRELHHSSVVRKLDRLGQLHQGSYAATIPLRLAKDWKQGDLRVVVFVQEPAEGKIIGAASIPAGSLSGSH